MTINLHLPLLLQRGTIQDTSLYIYIHKQDWPLTYLEQGLVGEDDWGGVPYLSHHVRVLGLWIGVCKCLRKCGDFLSEDCFASLTRLHFQWIYMLKLCYSLGFPETFTKFEDIEDWHPFGRPFKHTIDYSWITLSSKYGLYCAYSTYKFLPYIMDIIYIYTVCIDI